MANCNRCGKSLGFLSTAYHCDDCIAAIKAEQRKEQTQKEERIEIAREEQQKRKESLLLPKLLDIKSKLGNGDKIYLYDNIYVPVDSIVNQEAINDNFSIGILQALGLQGWEVVGIIPRTLGVGLTNRLIGPTPGSSPASWGAGLGGNVMGAHIILKMDASQQSLSDDFLMDYIKRNIDPLLTPDESQMLSKILEDAIE